ncbi:DUF3025 domain-containing protein [Advenella kashmirensis]|nr:DUF3025 domain-containing protein [Advenella kashmirensis]
MQLNASLNPMIVDVLSTLDLARPWWDPLKNWLPGGERWQQALPMSACGLDASATTVADLLNALAPAACPVRFVPQSALPAGVAYEQFIGQTGLCPTRDNEHDFFNGLCWFRFPEVKSVFNRIQSQQIARQGVGQRRGIIRDTITLLDEGGLFLLAPPPLWEAIAERDWQRAFVHERTLWAQAHVAPIGHALLEKCARPYKALTANVIRVPEGTGADEVDHVMAQVLADMLSPGQLQAKPHCPLPVMGIPGWDPANEDPVFYEDARVFSPPRR